MDVLGVLADPTRREILGRLLEGEATAGTLASAFPVSRPAISRHLRLLREAGLVQVRPDGQRRVYALDPQPLADVDAWLEPYRRLWAQRLDALDTEIRRGRRDRERIDMTAATPLGQVLRDAQGVRLEFVRTYDAPIEEVWSAITDSDRLSRWYGSWTGDLSSGTVEVLMTAEEGATPERVRILACDAPTTLVVQAPSPDGDWLLQASLHEDGGVTTLVFVQRMTEPYDASSIGPGWQFYLDRLAAVIDGGPIPENWDDYHPALEDAYPVPPG